MDMVIIKMRYYNRDKNKNTKILMTKGVCSLLTLLVVIKISKEWASRVCIYVNCELDTYSHTCLLYTSRCV